MVVLEPGDWHAWLHGTPEQADALIGLPLFGVLRSREARGGALLSAEQLADLNI